MWTPSIPSLAHPTPWAPPARGARRALIDVLLRVSALLVRTAVRLQRAPLLAPVPTRAAPAAAETPVSITPSSATLVAAREFHAEAGAPEGALYVDGQLVGHLSGVPRL